MLLYAIIAAGVAIIFAVISTILLFRGRKSKKKSKSKIDLSQDIYLEKELEMKEEKKNK
jgi:predicted membrane protein